MFSDFPIMEIDADEMKDGHRTTSVRMICVQADGPVATSRTSATTRHTFSLIHKTK